MDMVKQAVVRTLREREGPVASTLRGAARIMPSGLGQLASDHDLLRQGFDEGFYRRSNPDLAPEDATLSHFLTTGWKEGRDPNPNFSVEFYLAANPDVGDAGVNPFLHWLKFGRAEGRFSEPSGPRDTTAKPVAAPQKSLRLGVVAMVRNERDIVASFAEHLLAFFDEIVFIDHRSDDGTRDYLMRLAEFSDRVHVRRLDEPGYIQSVATSHVVADHPGFEDVDWIFLLDADEFLPFTTRQDLLDTLGHFSDAAVISMPWTNLVPETFWEGEVDLSEKVRIVEMPQRSEFRKIAFQPKLIDRKSVEVKQGNHTLSRIRNGVVEPARDAKFPIYHLPFRSMRQVETKLRQGTASYSSLGSERDKGQGNHWFHLAKALQADGDPKELLNAAIVDYGVAKPLEPVSVDDLVAKGGKLRELHVARQETHIDRDMLRSADVRLASTLGEVAETDPPARLVTTEDGRIVRVAEDDHRTYPALSESAPVAAEDRNGNERLAAFLRPTYWEIEELTPTAWGGHIPFLFALVNEARPRRYVELGSHFGASFFSYCRAARRCELKTEAIAIDAWEGDDHAGSYDERVFHRFCHMLRKYDDIGAFLRMYFERAAGYFAEGSIDLLHIDGLHTYEAVRQDYETWLPKMSDRGIIMFHDISVHERDFGVWKFWEEIEARHPAISFRHSHGLGVAYVGEDGKNPIGWLFDRMAEDAGTRHLLQQHLEEISQKAVELFRRRHAMGEGDNGLQEKAALADEVTSLRQRLSTAEAENADLRRLLADEVSQK